MSVDQSFLPPLNWLRAFEAAARHLSFTVAADELSMTQSAVSQHIKNLESHLGRILFIRKTRSIELTDAGLSYLPVIQEAFETLAIGTRMMTGGDRGKILSVNCNLAFSVFWLSPRLKKLYQQHPWLVLNITTATWDPSSKSSGVEVRFGRDHHKYLNAFRLNENTAFPVCTPEYAKGSMHWQETTLFDCAGVSANWENWARQKGEPMPKGKLVNLSSTYCVSLNAALGNAGLAMGHEMLTNLHLQQGQLIRPYDESIIMEEAYYLIEPPEFAKNPATEAFCSWIKEESCL